MTIGISSIPAFFSNFFTDLNPATVERVYWPTVFLSLVSALVFYGASQRWPSAAHGVTIALASICGATFVFLLMMIFDAVSFSPAANALLARLLLVTFFVALSGCLGTFISYLWDVLAG